jgi:hypothetical protein
MSKYRFKANDNQGPRNDFWVRLERSRDRPTGVQRRPPWLASRMRRDRSGHLFNLREVPAPQASPPSVWSRHRPSFPLHDSSPFPCRESGCVEESSCASNHVALHQKVDSQEGTCLAPVGHFCVQGHRSLRGTASSRHVPQMRVR